MSPRNRKDHHRDEPKQQRSTGQPPGSRRARRSTAAHTERPPRPSGWRDVLRNDYDYPPDIEHLGRRDRRHAMKEWRRDDYAQRMAWLREQRQAEPANLVSVLVVVVLLVIIVLGLGGGLPRILGGDKPEREPVGLLTPAEPLPLPTYSSSTESPSATDSSLPSPTDSIPPVQTERPSADDMAEATQVVGAWAELFYTRNPSTETYEQLVAKASQYMTADLAASFTAQGDSTYDALEAEGGTSKVAAAPVSAPRDGTSPADTTTRISRFVGVVIDITGSQPRRFTVPLLVTLVSQGATWVISDVDGGTGP